MEPIKDDRIVTLQSYFDLALAEMDRATLEEAGVPAMIAGDVQGPLAGFQAFSSSVIALQVFEKDVERASGLLREAKEES